MKSVVVAVDLLLKHDAGLPVSVIRTEHLMQPYVETLSAVGIGEGYEPSYLLANPGATINNLRRTVYGVGRLTGKQWGAAMGDPPLVEVEVMDYDGNSTVEALEVIAGMGEG